MHPRHRRLQAVVRLLLLLRGLFAWAWWVPTCLRFPELRKFEFAPCVEFKRSCLRLYNFKRHCLIGKNHAFSYVRTSHTMRVYRFFAAATRTLLSSHHY
jgi:hypothetical protein